MLSIRHALAESGLAIGKTVFSLRGDLDRWPVSGSLRTVGRALRDPRMPEWIKREKEYANEDWTASCQGVATDGTSWYFTSNDDGAPGVYHLSSTMGVVGKRSIPRTVAGHVGDVDYFEGRVYVALEHPTQFAVFDRSLGAQGTRAVSTPDGHFSWCAVNPWNGLLYTSAWNGADALYAFDRSTGARRDTEDIALDGSVNRVQGGTFSPNGRIYLASDDKSGAAGIHGFGLPTGRRLGFIPIEIHQGFPKYEETEGIGFGLMTSLGHPTVVHLVLLDQDAISDDIYFKTYEVPDLSVV